MDYRDMTMWQLEQERQKIIAEIERRIALETRARELGIVDGPHRIRSTACHDIGESNGSR